MRGKAALIGFLLLQAIVIALWVTALLPLMGPGAPPFISDGPHIWSGGAYLNLAENFRQRSVTESAAPFKLYGPLLWATLMMLASLATTFVGWRLFRAGRGMLAALGLAATLALGAGAAWLIVGQWGGSTVYPPGSVNTGWLYMATRTALIQMLIGYVLLVAYIGLSTADIAKKDRPLGFNWALLNWVICVAAWTKVYVGLFLVPILAAST